MFSAKNLAELEAAEQPYMLAIRVPSMKLGEAAVKQTEKLGLTRPKYPQAVREMELEHGRHRVVVFCAFKAQHDRIVRHVRLKKTRADLRSLARHAAHQKAQAMIASASRIFAKHETGQYWLPGVGRRAQLLAGADGLPHM
jgi:hypothetical protein